MKGLTAVVATKEGLQLFVGDDDQPKAAETVDFEEVYLFLILIVLGYCFEQGFTSKK